MKNINRNMKKCFSMLMLVLLISVKTQQYNTLSDTINNQDNFLNKELSSKEFLEQIKEQNSVTTSNSFISSSSTNPSIIVEGEYFDGFNLYVVDNHSMSPEYNRSATFLIVDMDGQIIAEKDFGYNSHISRTPAEFINSTTILYSEPFYATLWNIYTNVTVILPISGHHEYEYNPISNTIFTLQDYKIEINGDLYQFDKIVEYNMLGQLVWSLDTRSFISHTMWCPYHDTVDDAVDITHSNTVFFDVEEDIIYYNSRNVNTFYKINHSTKEILWGIGEYTNFTLYDINGNVKDNIFYHTHAVEKVDDNVFILFDNDYHNQTNYFNQKSRILEIIINENTLTANETWSWIAPPEYYSAYYGDADRLPNGNRLGVFGAGQSPGSTGARIVEVDGAGNIVWEIFYENSDIFVYNIYRVERFNLKPTIVSNKDIIATPLDTIDINWKTYYNFRQKMSVNGSYEIYLNGSLVESDTHMFEKFWKPSFLNVSLTKLAVGDYNLTVLIKDEAGHYNSDTINLLIRDFYIEKDGLDSYEKGYQYSNITWTGVTVNPLDYNLSIDYSIYQTSTWNGEILSYDLNNLLVGDHFIQLEIYNNSMLIHNDSFWVSIYPSESPEFIDAPIDQTIIWNNSLLLSWTIFDNTPSEWYILINGISYSSNIWFTNTETINWYLPIMDEEIYNITLVAYDLINQRTSHTIFITIESPSPPIISDIPTNTIIKWNTDTLLTWEVHGGNLWHIIKNDTMVSVNHKTSKYISLSVDDWQTSKWLPGVYNLTLVVSDEFEEEVASTIIVIITFLIGDPYADILVASSSTYYSNGENALGSPDGNYASIFSDYSNGYITLDMGLNEEILNGEGDDLSVFAGDGEYFVKVGNSLSQPFTTIGSGIGNQNYDLSSIGFSSARYILIEYRTGDYVELDAIEAIYYRSIEEDSEIPLIIEINDFWIWENQSSIFLEWEVYDLTPWNYSVSINNTIILEQMWDGTDITYEYLVDKTGNISVTLKIFDLFSNFAINTFNIEIRELPTEKSNFFISVTIIVLLCISYFMNNKKRRSLT